MSDAAVGIEKTETNETVWTGKLPADRLHDLVKRAVLESLGLSVWTAGVTVELGYDCLVAPTVTFRVAQDHNHWRKSLEAQADRASYEDAAMDTTP